MEINIKFCFALLKKLTNSEGFSESRTRISVPAFLLSHWSTFSSEHVSTGNDFAVFLFSRN
jgi:hypothetical protein